MSVGVAAQFMVPFCFVCVQAGCFQRHAQHLCKSFEHFFRVTFCQSYAHPPVMKFGIRVHSKGCQANLILVHNNQS
jgi:hypothetical protein